MPNLIDRTWDKSRPPSGDFAINRNCEQSQGLTALYPFGMKTLGVANVFNIVGTPEHLVSVASPGLRKFPLSDGCTNLIAASSQYWTVTLPVVTAPPFSMACLASVPAATTQTLMHVNGADTNNFFRIVLVSDKVRANVGTATGPAQANAITTASYDPNVVSCYGAVFTATNSRTVYYNGANSVSESTSIVPTGANTKTYIGIGIDGTGATLQPTNGQIGLSYFWNIAVSAKVMALIANPPTRYEILYPLRSPKWFLDSIAAGTAPIGAYAAASRHFIGVGVN